MSGEATVNLRRNWDGAVRTLKEKVPEANEYGDGPALLLFMWTEGNYGCDCNRHLFFERVVDPTFDGDMRCDDKEYACNIVMPDGSSLLKEF
jgi:hypothetical protein